MTLINNTNKHYFVIFSFYNIFPGSPSFAFFKKIKDRGGRKEISRATGTHLLVYYTVGQFDNKIF